jgi:glucose-1-phosphate thymidylyltransferase
MKGVVLAGGTGSRLYPLTKVTNKHLLPVYDKPMIYYPLFTLKESGIKDVLIVSGPEHSIVFKKLLGTGKDFGMRFSYAVQKNPGGIAHALALAKKFIGKDKFVVILGDNIINDNITPYVKDFLKQGEGAKVLLKKVKNPKAYGVCVVKNRHVINIEEKPKNPKSDLAVIGLYMYDSMVFDIIKKLKPSKRGELEITDVNNAYLKKNLLTYNVLKGFWGDCGESFDTLLYAAALVKNSRLKNLK